MSIVTELQKLRPPDIVLATFALLAVVSPGFLLIYLYKPELIGSLSTFKLLVFSTALTLPVVAFNYSLTLIRPMVKDFPFSWTGAILSLVKAFVAQHLALLIVYLNAYPFKTYLLVLGIFQFMVFIMWLVTVRMLNKFDRDRVPPSP
ncbi:MAG: hypothetical protein Q8J96_16185 [Rhodocyclaceae bacterium]|nr:hypothetical protein [Rhodocyclaceae bacterium]